MVLEAVVHARVEGEPLGVLDLRLVAVDADDGGVGPRGHVERDDAEAAARVEQAVARLDEQPVDHAPLPQVQVGQDALLVTRVGEVPCTKS